MEYATLQNGLKMPMEGFGVFQVRDKEECKRSVLDAIRTGYRLIDTAASYTNEDAVGEAVREAIAEGICTREELFITSKMWVQDMQNYEMAKSCHWRLSGKNRTGISGFILAASGDEGLLQRMAGYGGRVQGWKAESYWRVQLLSSRPYEFLRNCRDPAHGESSGASPLFHARERIGYYEKVQYRSGSMGASWRRAIWRVP